LNPFVAPAVFDEVGVSPSVAGAAGPVFDEVLVDGAVFGETLGESLTAKCCCFHTKCIFKGQKVTSAHCRVRSRALYRRFHEVLCVFVTDRRSYSAFTIPEIAPHNVSDDSCVATLQKRCGSIHYVRFAAYSLLCALYWTFHV